MFQLWVGRNYAWQCPAKKNLHNGAEFNGDQEAEIEGKRSLHLTGLYTGDLEEEE